MVPREHERGAMTTQPCFLVVDDEPEFLKSIRRGLQLAGFSNVVLESDPCRAAAYVRQEKPADVAILDLTMPGMSGIELLELIKCISPVTECIMVTGANEAGPAVTCLKKGAHDYLVKPVLPAELIAVIHKALERKNLLEILRLGKQAKVPVLVNAEPFRSIVTRSAGMFRILKEAELHAGSDMPVLITGESGTGKELFARAIHMASPRAGGTFLPVNMSALSGTLFDAEFFGHTKGSFTGALQDRQGYLEAAAGGTLFLDEIGSLPLEFQGKLLRVLQEGEYFKLGTSKPRSVDVRFVAATNADLQQLQEEGSFRRDLFYRLCGAWLHLPPLRERKEDIPLLVKAVLNERGCDPCREIPDPTWTILQSHDYPGNIRELRAAISSALNLAREGPLLPRFLPAHLRTLPAPSPRQAATTPITPVASSDFPDGIVPLEEAEKRYITSVYRHTGGNKLQTARLLDIALNTLRRKLRAYGLE